MDLILKCPAASGILHNELLGLLYGLGDKNATECLADKGLANLSAAPVAAFSAREARLSWTRCWANGFSYIRCLWTLVRSARPVG